MKQEIQKSNDGRLEQLTIIPCVLLPSNASSIKSSHLTLPRVIKVSKKLANEQHVVALWAARARPVPTLLARVKLLSTAPGLIALIGGTKVQFAEQVADTDTPAELEEPTHLN